MAFRSARELAAGQDDAPPAAPTLESNISTQAHDQPIRGAAGMSFSQGNRIADLVKFRFHGYYHTPFLRVGALFTPFLAGNFAEKLAKRVLIPGAFYTPGILRREPPRRDPRP